MAYPTAYYPAYNFTQYQVSHPATPLPAASVDAELFSISTSITQIVTALEGIMRSDGALANNSVGMQQLQTSLFTGVNPATNWLTNTAYTQQMSVYENNAVYLCLVSHTSGVFATDLAAGYWELILNFSTYISAAAASATAAASSATAAAASAANLTGTSATSVTPNSGSQTFTTQSGKFFNVGNNVAITSNANPTVNFMHGVVTSYSGTTLIVNVNAFGGSGAHTDWTINVSGAIGATGATGSPGAGTGDMLKANNLSELTNFATARTNLGLGSAAVQAASFFCETGNNLSDVSSAATAFANIKQTGTSSATGALQLATNTQAIAGTDTALAVTCAGVAAAITAHVPSFATLTGTLGADITMTNSGQWYDGPSVAQGTTGVFNVDGGVTLTTGNGVHGDNLLAKLHDGTNIYDSRAFGFVATATISTTAVSLSAKGVTNPAGNLRISIQNLTTGGSIIRSNISGLGHDSQIQTLRIG